MLSLIMDYLDLIIAAPSSNPARKEDSNHMETGNTAVWIKGTLTRRLQHSSRVKVCFHRSESLK